MARVTLRLDMSEALAVIKAAADLYQRLPGPQRDAFCAGVDRLMADRRLAQVEPYRRGDPVAVLASAELLDLMRRFEAL